MLGPSRPLPRVGARVRIRHFGGDAQEGTILAVEDDGRRVRVLAAPPGTEGDELEFVLSPKTARFVSALGAHGPRLDILG